MKLHRRKLTCALAFTGTKKYGSGLESRCLILHLTYSMTAIAKHPSLFRVPQNLNPMMYRTTIWLLLRLSVHRSTIWLQLHVTVITFAACSPILPDPDRPRRRSNMSERSKNLARYIRKAKTRPPDLNQLDHTALLNKGFALLKENLAREFHNQISEVNHEPGCMDSLGSAFTEKDSRVFKIGKNTKVWPLILTPSNELQR